LLILFTWFLVAFAEILIARGHPILASPIVGFVTLLTACALFPWFEAIAGWFASHRGDRGQPGSR
jgi:hypothetical protein